MKYAENIQVQKTIRSSLKHPKPTKTNVFTSLFYLNHSPPLKLIVIIIKLTNNISAHFSRSNQIWQMTISYFQYESVFMMLFSSNITSQIEKTITFVLF